MFLTSVLFWHNFNFIHIAAMFMLCITLLEPEKFLGANRDFKLNHKKNVDAKSDLNLELFHLKSTANERKVIYTFQSINEIYFFISSPISTLCRKGKIHILIDIPI